MMSEERRASTGAVKQAGSLLPRPPVQIPRGLGVRRCLPRVAKSSIHALEVRDALGEGAWRAGGWRRGRSTDHQRGSSSCTSTTTSFIEHGDDEAALAPAAAYFGAYFFHRKQGSWCQKRELCALYIGRRRRRRDSIKKDGKERFLVAPRIQQDRAAATQTPRTPLPCSLATDRRGGEAAAEGAAPTACA